MHWIRKWRWHLLWLTPLVIIAIAMCGFLAVPLIGKLTYDADRCRAYSAAQVSEYVRQDLKPGQAICSLQAPLEWRNDFAPYNISVCDSSGRQVHRVEVYPDCGLEWRDPR